MTASSITTTGITGESEGDEYLEEPVMSQVRRRAPVICVLAG